MFLPELICRHDGCSYRFTGTLCCAGVFDSHMFWKQKERAPDGSFMSVSRYQGNVIVDRDATVETCDMTATNGVVHAIDQVQSLKLLPTETWANERQTDIKLIGEGRKTSGVVKRTRTL